MYILANHSLKPYNTLWVDAIAKELMFLESADDCITFSKLPGNNILLWWWSNVLLTSDYYDHVWVIQDNQTPELVEDNDHHTIIKVKAGYSRDSFVQWTLEHGYDGLENMGLIPGTVGAGTLGSIGAYGKEIGMFVDQVEYIDLTEGEIKLLSHHQCQFSYRRSIFKSMSNYCIRSVYFRFWKSTHKLSTHYPDIQKYLLDHAIRSEELTAKKLYQIICEIRTNKMPSRDEWWCAGSFRKNPTVEPIEKDRILAFDPDLKYFPYEDKYKLAAGYLLEHLWYRWMTIVTPSWWSVGCYKDQTLILVNNGGTGKEIDTFAQTIEKAVFEYYGVVLEREAILL